MPLFNLPQFTEVESKIFGPLTFKQFIFLLITIGGGFILYKSLPKFVGLPIVFILVLLGIALAFVKVNGIPFPQFFSNAVYFLFKPKKIVWAKGKKAGQMLSEIEIKKLEKKKVEFALKKNGKLKDLLTKIETKK